MKIALVNDYSLHHIGGAVASMFEQKRALEAAGHEVIIIQLGKQRPGAGYDETGIVYVKPSFILPKVALYMPVIFAKPKHDALMKEILTSHGIEIVHCQSEMTLAHLVVRNATALNIPVFFTVHTIFWQYDGPLPGAFARIARHLYEKAFREKITDFHPTGNAVERLLKNITLNLASKCRAVISPSLHQKETLEQTDLKTPITVLPNPFTSTLAPASFVKNDGHIPRFVWVGRCAPEKRPLEFLEGVAKARTLTARPFKVDIVGDGPLLEKMRHTSAHEDTIFHGQQPHDEAVRLIDQGDVVCATSYHFDNQPMIIAEAISRRRAVLYCDERLKEGTDLAGYLTRDETPDSIAAALVDLVEHPDTIAVLSHKAEQAARVFAPDAYAAAAVACYKS